MLTTCEFSFSGFFYLRQAFQPGQAVLLLLFSLFFCSYMESIHPFLVYLVFLFKLPCFELFPSRGLPHIRGRSCRCRLFSYYKIFDFFNHCTAHLCIVTSRPVHLHLSHMFSSFLRLQNFFTHNAPHFCVATIVLVICIIATRLILSCVFCTPDL